ncbi:MAG TPA: hypothetical protein VGB99_00660 [Acidobacteriota bacterium]|jgi:hypothetical protein
MTSIVKFMRFYLILLAIFTIGRWALSLSGVPYEKGHYVFSLVILNLVAAAHHAAFARAFLGWRIPRALALGAALAVVTQVVILLSTVVSYAAGVETYFNHPTALNLPEAAALGRAFGIRLFGLVVNTVLNVVAAALGWLLGGVLPARDALA